MLLFLSTSHLPPKNLLEQMNESLNEQDLKSIVQQLTIGQQKVNESNLTNLTCTFFRTVSVQRLHDSNKCGACLESCNKYTFFSRGNTLYCTLLMTPMSAM
jgi:hypothetical protein